MKQAFVLYANDSYADTVEACVHSIITHSSIPVIVYMLNSDRLIKNALTIRWDCDVAETKQNKFIDRSDINIYKLLIQRPLIVKDAINKFAYTVAYVDSDSVATKYIDNIFNMFDNDSNYPYFVEGIYDYLHVGDRGGAMSRDDLSTTLEHPACELFGVDQYVRERYRQTGYFVANKNCIDFLDEWYQMCTHPEVMADNNYYAAYNEETIANVLLWKYNMQKGLPYIYMNAGLDLVNLIDHNNIFTGQDYMIGDWGRVPASEDKLLFYHGEKRKEEMLKMIRPNKILYLVPHLSTGGMPAFVLKTIEVMQEYINVCVVEYNCYSLDYVVQRDKIIELVGNNFYTLFEDKTELFDIIKYFNPDIIHIHEPSERFDAHIMSELYRPNRLYKIIETCHDVSFNPKTKLYHPDAYAFCTPYHYDTFAHLPSYKKVIEYPIDPKESKKLPGINNVVNIGLWTPGKNQAEGIEIARANPNFNFNFVGNQAGNFKDYWEPLMTDLPSNVKVWGERDDVDEFLKHANIFMFNSTWECNPLVLREAISYGLPIVAHNLPVYRSRYDKYIQPIDTDLNTITCNYIVPTDNTSEIFAEKYNNFYNKVLMMPHEDQDVHIHKYFVNGPFLEIKSPVNSEFKVQYFDENNVCQYENIIGSNSWVRLNREYYTDWTIKVFEYNELVYEYKLSLENRRVFITLSSKSLGDTIAWAPYALAFQKKHNCKVILSTFWNHILDMPEIELVEPGMVVNDIFAQYNIGWHYDENKEPVLPNTIKLQEAATKILGLEFEELRPNLKFRKRKNKYGQYVVIATNSTAGCKFWTREGWQEVITYLHEKGYKVINISKEDNPFKHCQKIDDIDIENTMSVIYHSQFAIGLSSGISHLAWAVGKKIIMIANFTIRTHEFKSIRIVNENVCHGCWNKAEYKFDKSDFNWCPLHKGTDRMFECQKSITSEMVINEIKKLI